jgi:Tol biopolymer transport system component
MAIAAGVRLGPYEIVAAIGAGGMGEVYRARDTRLDRIVAIKILPTHLAADPQLRERFDREARAISSLNHPHICALFDVGHDEVDYLVLEFLEGQTLADRLRSGPLPVADALKCAVQIADALDRAHRSGVVHRDLKPANVMLTRAGAKLLDFGLAKTAAPVVAISGLSMMPTTPPAVTAQGAILGTFQYMAPEQIEGLDADARTDIFAFGAVLFEMLTGRTAFEGKTRASLLGAILKDEPPRVSAVQPLVPKAVDRIVATCLAKDPDERWQSVRDCHHEITWAMAEASQSVPAAAVTRRAPLTWAATAVLAIALATTTTMLLRQTPEVRRASPVQFTVAPPENSQFGGPAGGGSGQAAQIAVSPDGREIAFVAATQGANQGVYKVWVRSLGSLAPRAIAGSEEGTYPFWSPDNRFIAFFAGGKLKKVQAAGGPPVVLCDAVGGRGGTWNREDVIVFAPSAAGPLLRVSSAGGAPSPATALDTQYGETNHRFPHFLPDGRHFFYTAVTGAAPVAPRPSVIKIGALDSARVVATLFPAESSVQFASGHLLFLRDATLMAQSFDPSSRQAKGEPFPIAERVGTEGSRYVTFSASPGGILAYGHGDASRGQELTWYERSGKILSKVGDIAIQSILALSPDDRRAAISITTGSPPNRDVWVVDLARAVNSRITSNPGDDSYPVWSPDGARIAFQSIRGQESGIHVALSSGDRDESLFKVVPPALVARPTDWSRDGRFLAFTQGGPGGADVWVLPLTGDRTPFPVAHTSFIEDGATFSPDGRWLAFSSNESGQFQVYVQPFPPTGEKHPISGSGGAQPVWRSDGRELFFITQDATMMAASIDTTHGLSAGLPQRLFASRASGAAQTGRQYGVTRDGKRFLMVTQQLAPSTTPLTVVVDWLAAVQK